MRRAAECSIGRSVAVARRAAGARAGSENTTEAGQVRRQVKFRGKTYQETQLIWLVVTGAWAGTEIDHRDGDGLNNRWSNLRRASDTEQQHNTKTRATNRTGLKWVRVCRRRFQAVVGHEYLGTFATAQRAHDVARTLARKRHGKFFNSGARAPSQELGK